MPYYEKYIIKKDDDLIKFLNNQGISKSKIKSLIKYRTIKINDTVVTVTWDGKIGTASYTFAETPTDADIANAPVILITERIVL